METRIIMTKEQFENNINCKMNYDELIYEEIQKYNVSVKYFSVVTL